MVDVDVELPQIVEVDQVQELFYYPALVGAYHDVLEIALQRQVVL